MTADFKGLDRRAVLGGLGTLAATGPAAFAASPPLPAAPVAISIIDVGGALALMQKAFEDYRTANPKLVSRIAFVKAPAPELASKLKAQQDAGQASISTSILTGSDGLAAGLEQKLWQKILPDFADKFPNIEANYEPAALNLHKVAGRRLRRSSSTTTPPARCSNTCPTGSRPRRPRPRSCSPGPRPIRTSFMYARPTNSGTRPHLHDGPALSSSATRTRRTRSNGWDKTWAYLQELGQYIEYYPAGTGATMKEFGDGSRDIIISTTGWDINPRALGIVPKEAKIQTLKGFHWVSDAFFMCVPKGVPNDRLAVVLDMMAHVLTPKMQAYSYDEGYLYPGPAVKNVPLSLAPESSQKVIAEFGRPEYADLIAKNPIELPLKPDKMVVAFRKWDELVGAKRAR